MWKITITFPNLLWKKIPPLKAMFPSLFFFYMGNDGLDVRSMKQAQTKHLSRLLDVRVYGLCPQYLLACRPPQEIHKTTVMLQMSMLRNY